MDSKYIALCGAPGSGKTTVANMLAHNYRANIVDDGLGLRHAVAALYDNVGVDPTDPFTQEGKDKYVTVCGKIWTVRQLLGDLGTLLEEKYGWDFMPNMALAQADRGAAHMPPGQTFVFPSVRKMQGHAFIKRGGVVVEVVRPGFECFNEFDFYERKNVTHTIYNTGSLERLKDDVDAMFAPMLSSF